MIKLYGLTFRSFDIDKYHEELLMSNGWKKQISRYFLCLEKENEWRWMTSYKSQFVKTESTKDRTSQTYVISETYRNKTFLIDF
jgi:hypothetical protein